MQNIIVSTEALKQIASDMGDVEVTKRHDMTIELLEMPTTIVAVAGEEKGSDIRLYVYDRYFCEDDPHTKPQCVVVWPGDGHGRMQTPRSEDCDLDMADRIASVYMYCLLFVNSSEEFNPYETSDENYGKWMEHLVITKEGSAVTGKVLRGTDRPDLVCCGVTGEEVLSRPCALEEEIANGEKEPFYKMIFYDYIVG